MDKEHEVEYRALITAETFDALLARGKKECTQTFQGPLTIHDAYFCPQYVKEFDEVEMDKVGSYSLRLRREFENGATTITLNAKVIREARDHNAWLEHEITLSSYEECRKILEAIGFKIFFELKKNRYSFHDGETHVCLEDIDDFQPAIEVEILTSEDKTDEAKKKLLEYLARNRIPQEAIVEKSVTNMLMRQKASF